MKKVQSQTIDELLELSRLLGEFGQIKRITCLPNGERESDSHHSFALALIAFELAAQYAPELDTRKIMLYSLVHDLPELVSGDMQTLTASAEELKAKAARDEAAFQEAKKHFKSAPNIIEALEAYEARADEEALFVYWIDKMITIPTHFFNDGKVLREYGVTTQKDIQGWYERQRAKLDRQKGVPHTSAVQVLEMAYQKMHDELFDK